MWPLNARHEGDHAHRDKNWSNKLEMTARKHVLPSKILSYPILDANEYSPRTRCSVLAIPYGQSIRQLALGGWSHLSRRAAGQYSTRIGTN
jgi:hypothetical protein